MSGGFQPPLQKQKLFNFFILLNSYFHSSDRCFQTTLTRTKVVPLFYPFQIVFPPLQKHKSNITLQTIFRAISTQTFSNLTFSSYGVNTVLSYFHLA